MAQDCHAFVCLAFLPGAVPLLELAQSYALQACAHMRECALDEHLIPAVCPCSNANPGDFQGRESPPWSPRRVPPAHLWGEGPPRHPGYRSGGATLRGVSEGEARNVMPFPSALGSSL